MKNINLEEILFKINKVIFYKYFDSFDFYYMLFIYLFMYLFIYLVYVYFVRFLLFLLYYHKAKIQVL